MRVPFWHVLPPEFGSFVRVLLLRVLIVQALTEGEATSPIVGSSVSRVGQPIIVQLPD